MADLRVQFNEEMVGTGHPAKADTLNRLSLVEHNNDGTHKYNPTGYKEIDLREFLPVGFVTNGSVDYSTEVQACITAGNRIFIPAGTWLCENLNVRGYRNIRGAGRGNTVLRIPAASTRWLINSSDGATSEWMPYSSITDLSIDGNSSTTALGGIYAEFVTQWLFERITMYGFYNSAAVGLWLNHAYQIAMRDCYIRMGSTGAGKKGEACFKMGALTADPVHSTHITYDNCLAQYSGTGFLLAAMGNRGDQFTIRQCAAGNHDYGIRVQDNYRSVRVENTLIENTSINGVRITTATAYNIHNVRLEDITMYENTVAVYAANVDGLNMDKLRFAGDDVGGHTAFSLNDIKRLELGTYNIEDTAYDTIVAASTIDPRLPNLALNDTTPTVAVGGKKQAFKTQSTGATTITMFDDGVVGQEITVIFADANTTIDFTGTNLKGNGGVDFTGAVGDVMTGVFDGTNWYFQVHDNTP